MTLVIPSSLLGHTDYQPLLDRKARYGSDTVNIAPEDMTDEMLAAIGDAAEAAGDNGIKRVIDAIVAARSGEDKAIPRLTAAPEMILAYLRRHLADGWLYKREDDGHLHPWLVTDVVYHEASRQGASPFVSISLIANGRSGGGRDDRHSLGVKTSSESFEATSIVRKRAGDVLAARGLYVETADLREDYDQWLEHYIEVMGGFAEQYRLSGFAIPTDRYGSRGDERAGHKVIHDISPREVQAPALYAEAVLFAAARGERGTKGAKKARIVTEDGEAEHGYGPVPTHFDVRVFDLASHDFVWVNGTDLVRYQYDKTLREKIILPADQRNLLDILTTDLGEFTADIIEGKSTGNVILAKGEPGVGKTLTAEVYSEVIERPLYSIHSGNLGVQADDVRKNLETAFKRAKRWNAVLLLDEADVFVLQRGSNITQNAIVAEFLRTLEYFDGLLFMTTNRADNIDDAILSRAAAIIDYAVPDVEGIRAVWEVQARNQGVTIEPALLDALVDGFARITPRDVKMLLRLALRVAKGNGHDLDVDTFARCAMFRGLHFQPGSRGA